MVQTALFGVVPTWTHVPQEGVSYCLAAAEISHEQPQYGLATD